MRLTLGSLTRVFSVACLLMASCKPSGSGQVKAVLGTDRAGFKHAVGILPLRNLVPDNLVNRNNEGASYALDVIDGSYWGIVDCIDTPGMTGVAALKDIELSAALGQVYIDKDRTLFRRRATTGKIDERLLCVVQGPRLFSVGTLGDALNKAYGAKPAEADIKLSQAIFLGLRGNTIKKDKKVDYRIKSALMAAFLDQFASQHNFAKMPQAEFDGLLAKYDGDLNPCVGGKGKFGAPNQRFKCAQVPNSKSAYDYEYVGGIEDYTDLLATRLSELHNQRYDYNESRPNVHALWEVMTSTTKWGSKSGKAGTIGAYFTGKKGLDYARYFASAVRDREDSGAVLGLSLADARVSTGRTFAGRAPSPNGGRPSNPSLPAKPGQPGVGPSPVGPIGPAGNRTPGLSSSAALEALKRRDDELKGKLAKEKEQFFSGGGDDTRFSGQPMRNEEFRRSERGLVADTQMRMQETQQRILEGDPKDPSRNPGVMSQIKNGDMKPSTTTEYDGSTRFTNEKTGETAFVDKSGSVQTWRETKAPSGATEYVNPAIGDPHAPGDKAGFSQTIDAQGQRAINVSFGGDGDKGEAGVDKIPMSLDKNGRPFIDCKNDAKAAQAVRAAELDYQKGQQELKRVDAELGKRMENASADEANRLLEERRTVREQQAKNDEVIGTINAMKNCGGGSKLSLADDDCASGGGDGGTSTTTGGDAAPKPADPKTPEDPTKKADEPNNELNPDGGQGQVPDQAKPADQTPGANGTTTGALAPTDADALKNPPGPPAPPPPPTNPDPASATTGLPSLGD